MIAKLLGLLDLLCVLVIFSSSFLPHPVIMFFAMLLFAKGMIFAFSGNAVSILDAAAGIYLGILVYGWSNVVFSWFFILFLLQKGFVSLFA